MNKIFLVLIALIFITKQLTIQNKKHSKFINILNIIFKRVHSAYRKSTFAVGCALVDNKNGRVITTFQNRVIKTLKNNQTFNGFSVLHAQTQTIKWFWENKEKYNLSQPSDYTIVTSLDPCLMCTGNILLSGFNVGTIQDDSTAGIGYRKTAKFNQWKNISTQIYQSLRQKFGYYKIERQNNRNYYKGSRNVYFKQQVVPHSIYKKLLKYKRKGSENARNNKNGFIDKKLQKDLSMLSNNSKTVRKLKQVFPEALSMKVNFKNLEKGFVPSQLEQLLKNKVQEARNGTNAIAMIDQYDNLICVQVDSFEKGPIFTSIFNLQYKYYKMYIELIDEESSNADGYKNSDPYLHLPDVKQSRYVILNGPDTQKLESVQFMGLFEYLFEGKQLQPVIVYINKLSDSLNSFIQTLPPLYSNTMSEKMFMQKKNIMNDIGKIQ